MQGMQVFQKMQRTQKLRKLKNPMIVKRGKNQNLQFSTNAQNEKMQRMQGIRKCKEHKE